MKKYKLEITTFIAGATGMIIELVASRILSPYLGSSNLIWTCIIGMMLAFMSIGYFIGGKISDKHPKINLLSLLILDASIFISIIPLIEVYAIEPLSKKNISLPIIAIICSTITFGIPSLLLATASPFAVKLKEKDEAHIGQVSGKMSAISTIGSIFGTFLAGFVLIPKLGVKNIILMVVIILNVLSFILQENKNIKYIIKSITILAILIVVVLFGKRVFYQKYQDMLLDTDSEYSRIWIRKLVNNSGKEFSTLEVDLGLESIASNEKKLTSEYLKYYDLFNYYQTNTNNVLLIGGAAYTYPSYYLENYENKKIDVVEIDPKMTELAQKYFNLDTTNPSLTIYHEDGRRFLNTSNNKYECILVDAFKGLNVPFQLTTIEALQNEKRLLTDDGIIISNIFSALEGDDSKFLKNEYATYQKIFQNVKVFKVDLGQEDNTKMQNYIIIAFNGAVAENTEKYEKYANLLSTEILDFTNDGDILTDDLCDVVI